MADPRRLDNRYDLVRPVGQGGMGVVWEAKDALLNRRVAIKEIKLPAAVPDEEQEAARARLLREARAAARLQHPSAVTVYTVVTDGTPYIVMEYVDAPSLTDLVRREGTLSPERAARIGMQMVDCLQAAHAADIVHRDVKPSNVLVVSEPQLGVDRVKLTDFGIARMAGDLKVTMTGAVLGSPPYMSPEQATDRPATPATDYWGLGATLYYAVEGEPPFQREQPMLTMHAVVSEPPRPPVKAGALGPVILALLRKDPTARPTGTAVARMLEQAIGAPGTAAAGPVADAPTTTLPPVAAPPPFRPTAAAAEPLVPGPGAGQPPPPSFSDYDRLENSYRRDLDRHRRGDSLRWVAAIVLLCGLLAGALWVGYLVMYPHHKKDAGHTTPPSTLTSVPAGPPTVTGPTARPSRPASGSPSAGALPAGCRRGSGGAQPAVNPGGKYCFVAPNGWKAYPETAYEANLHSMAATPTDGSLRFIRVQSQQPGAADPMASAEGIERSFSANNENYERLRMEQGTWAGHDAVLWEFTYSKDNADLHSLDVLFTSGDTGYAVLMRSTDDDWDSYAGVRSQFEKNFSVLS
ncbi:MAG: protein kinase domain-containing protein [Mycobacteriales bacterium]